MESYGNADVHARGELLLDIRNLRAHGRDDIQRVGSGQHPDAHESRLRAGEADILIVAFRAQHHIRHIAEAHDGIALLPHDQLLEFLGRAQVGIRHQVHGDHRALGGADGGEVVIRAERGADLRRGDIQRGHAVGLQPDAHGEGARAEDIRALHAADGGELRLHDAGQVIGDLVLVEIVRVKAQVHRRELVVARLADRRWAPRPPAADRSAPARASPGSGSGRRSCRSSASGAR